MIVTIDGRARFEADGYLLLPGALPAAPCEAFARAVMSEYHRLTEAGWRFAEAGRLAGHLNIIMGDAGRPLLEAAKAAGLPQLVEDLAGEPVALCQAMGNLNLPGSSAQDFHIDGAFARRVFIANICLVPTDATNGATEVVPGSHASEMSYWRFARDGWRSKTVGPALRPGDVLLRPSNLWHRGTPNRSPAPRPQATLSWLPASLGPAPDPFTDLDGPVTILHNKYYGRFRHLKEWLAVRTPLLDEAIRQGSSLLGDLRRR